MGKKAVALKYRKDKDAAPRIIAKGNEFLAGRIIALAQEYKVPVYHDSRLAEALYRLELGAYIPEEFYQVIATILAWVYTLDKKKGVL